MTPQEHNISHPAPLDVQSKVCSRCGYLKPLSEFKKRPKNTDGLNGVCRPCENERDRSKYFPRIPDDSIKKCCKCLVEKLSSQFDTNRSKTDGLNTWCKDCILSYSKEWAKEPKVRERIKVVSKIRYDNNPELFRKRTRKWKRNNWIYTSLQRCKRRAKQKGVPFNIESSDLLNSSGVLPEYCVIFPHIRLDYFGGSDRRLWASVDRIVPELGYTKGNVCVISLGANTWKSNGSNPQERRRIVQIMTGSRKEKRIDVNQGQGSLFNL